MPMLINEPLAAIPGRTYTAWIPSNPPLATAPVILVFHGGGQETATIARAWGVVPPGPPPANVADYIIVFPQTHPELEDRWYTFSSRSVGFPEIDLNYTDALIDELTTRLYPTGAGAVNPQVTGDPALVYASGFSSGGGMVWQMINSPLVARLAGAAAVGKPLDVEKASRYRRTIAPVAPAPIPMFDCRAPRTTASAAPSSPMNRTSTPRCRSPPCARCSPATASLLGRQPPPWCRVARASPKWCFSCTRGVQPPTSTAR